MGPAVIFIHFAPCAQSTDAESDTLRSTFPLVLQLVVPLAAAALLAGRVGAEGALAHKRGATGVEGRRHAALLLPPLLPLQTGGEGAADRVAQPLPLQEAKGADRSNRFTHSTSDLFWCQTSARVHLKNTFLTLPPSW